MLLIITCIVMKSYFVEVLKTSFYLSPPLCIAMLIFQREYMFWGPQTQKSGLKIFVHLCDIVVVWNQRLSTDLVEISQNLYCRPEWIHYSVFFQKSNPIVSKKTQFVNICGLKFVFYWVLGHIWRENFKIGFLDGHITMCYFYK